MEAKTYFLNRSAAFDSPPFTYDMEGFKKAIEGAGGMNFHEDNLNGWSNQPKVACFDATEDILPAIKEALHHVKPFDKDYRILPTPLLFEKDWTGDDVDGDDVDGDDVDGDDVDGDDIPKLYKYKLSSTGDSSAKYGNCEVCEKYSCEIFIQSVLVQYKRLDGTLSWTHHETGCTTFGHEDCLQGIRKPNHIEHPTMG